ncbi:SNF2 family DNA or RNA helicase [Desulfomicrobium macestii]|uniref:SNF2 family DNA or RNA helicase n=1 Tax=Desulfomicrobium macestii TaxID=90731 RepID=A0ABR9H760_9BACT|nr:SNF2 family DNA or RNA helicase [Desulfomicrobium macestii]
MRDYQFSLSRIDWGIVAFDEAQNIKNPNTLQTRAAKALKADFKLLATGTPVENSLTDFWCLMDTAQPGLLGTWATFRDSYITPINQASEDEQDQVRLEIGKKLRDDVGPFMLRRLKSEELDGLPVKRIFTGVMIENKDGWQFDPLLSSTMQGKQLSSYDNILKDFYVLKESGQAGSKALTALAQLRAISLHPALMNGDGNPVQNPHESAKITCVFNTIQAIKNRNEKVIIFAITKKLQSMLKIWIQKQFGIDAGIINGDTKAVSSSSGAETRKGLIEKFEAKEGFNVIIMSPVAAGVGLTVVGANNVIHLERHWNPAKEAQATDRVYRIGATRDVNIYIPALHHPEHISFDVLLNKLLMNKIAVSDAVVTPQAVTEMEMTRIFE